MTFEDAIVVIDNLIDKDRYHNGDPSSVTENQEAWKLLRFAILDAMANESR